MMPSPHFDLLGPAAPGRVVVEIPHAGLALDPLAPLDLALPRKALAAAAPWADSDVGADLLGEGLESLGVRRIVARTSRHVLDLNTEPRFPTPYEDKLPPGLGDVRTLSSAGLWWWERRRTRAELEALVAEVFEPYHEALSAELAASRAHHGRALLLSLHTYPDAARPDAPQLVLGTRNGQCAPPALRDALAATARAHGLTVALESPFPGGYSLRRHASPDTDAVQIELARSLVCSPGCDPRAPSLDTEAVTRTAEVVRALVQTAMAELAGPTP